MGNPNSEELGLEYWVRWQVPVCALIFVIPAVISVILMKRWEWGGREAVAVTIKSTDMWVPRWRKLSPLWLLFFRAFAMAVMAFLLYQTVATFGIFVFYFYTQWTFTLVLVFFALGTFVSARGIWNYRRKLVARSGETDNFIKEDLHDGESETATASKGIGTKVSNKLQSNTNLMLIEQPAGLCDYLMQIIYQTCAGAVMLTDIVFWCLLLPFMTGENFRLTLLIGCMHSVNAIFLFLDSILNSLPFPWYRFAYFVLWSCLYVVFQWILHAFGVTWWPYPFLELSTPWAPLWYLGLALVHVPCYGLYAFIIKAKDSICSRLFPTAFVRVLASTSQNSLEKKQK